MDEGSLSSAVPSPRPLPPKAHNAPSVATVTKGALQLKKVNPRTIAQLAILVALEVVLSRFLSINLWSNKIGFAFVPIAVTAMLYGPVTTGVTAAVADLIGALLFPSGAFFPGFTLTAFLNGMVFSLAFHNKQTAPRILLAVVIRELGFSLFLNTLWLSIMYNSPYWPLLTTARLWQCLIMVPVQFTVILVISKALPRAIKTMA